MPRYPSIDLLTAAVSELTGRHPLTIITVPAILRSASENHGAPTSLQPFGSAQERMVLDAFKVNNTKKPYLAVWSDPPQLVNHDYAGSTLQRLRTQDILGRSILRDDYDLETKRRRKFALRTDAGRTLAASQLLISKAALATWLGRHEKFDDLTDLVSWFDKYYPLIGTDLKAVYKDGLPSRLTSITQPFEEQPVSDELISALFGVTITEPAQVVHPPSGAPLPGEVGVEADAEAEGLSWTREVCEFPLRDAEPRAISARVLAELRTRHIVLPDEERLVRRCVIGLLVGHLILQGPPGTGKTTFARALARGFGCNLVESTATSDWSPFHVVGGLRPSATGGLVPVYGKVTEAAKACAKIVRAAVNAEEAEAGPAASALAEAQTSALNLQRKDFQATWLLIDEFNRADIDKAIGSLYTLLSSCDPEHLASTPLDLWFETHPDNRRLWVPARFRIIGAMNDLDTSFVSRMSLGLTRRFTVVTVGVPTTRAADEKPVTPEVVTAFAGAHAWLDRTYGSVVTAAPIAQSQLALASEIEMVQIIIDRLRQPANNVAGWPVGTAQVVDVLRALLLRTSSDPDTAASEALDFAVADRLVPQMSGIDEDQHKVFTALFNDLGLKETSVALAHIFDPHSLP